MYHKHPVNAHGSITVVRIILLKGLQSCGISAGRCPGKGPLPSVQRWVLEPQEGLPQGDRSHVVCWEYTDQGGRSQAPQHTPSSLRHPPPHQPLRILIHTRRTSVCMCPSSPHAPGTWASQETQPLSAWYPCPIRNPWTAGGCAHGSPIWAGRPSVFAYNLRVLTQPFPSLQGALPS